MIKLTNLLKEIIDIYSPEELNSKGIKYNILEDTLDNTLNNHQQNNYEKLNKNKILIHVIK